MLASDIRPCGCRESVIRPGCRTSWRQVLGVEPLREAAFAEHVVVRRGSAVLAVVTQKNIEGLIRAVIDDDSHSDSVSGLSRHEGYG